VCTMTAGWLKIFSADPKLGFLAHADKYAAAIADGKVLAPAKTLDAMSRVVFNDRLDAALCALFMGVVISVLIYSVKAVLAARRTGKATAQETAFVLLPAGQRA
jgi:carbon starvation protein CstA